MAQSARPGAQEVVRPSAPVPVTVVTGFLGSGKTTLLNHLLAQDHGLRVGLIVNDFGAISIDDKLIARRDERMVELANGCVCCSMNGDLLRSLADILNGDSPVDYILVETSGVADPLPVADMMLAAAEEGAVRLDGIVTLVDSDNFDENLDRAEVAYNQLAYGDILLVNKVDLVEAEVPGLIEAGIRKINPSARLIECVDAKVDPDILLDVDVARLRARASAPGHDHADHAHHAHAAFEQVAFRSDTPLDPAKFEAFLDTVPDRVFRAKGILNMVGADRRYVFHLVGRRRSVLPGPVWGPGEARATELVFIGRGFDPAPIERGLAACAASAE